MKTSEKYKDSYIYFLRFLLLYSTHWPGIRPQYIVHVSTALERSLSSRLFIYLFIIYLELFALLDADLGAGDFA